MSKIEMATTELGETARALRDDELDSVSGGFGFVEHGLTAPGIHLPPNPCRGAFFLRNSNSA